MQAETRTINSYQTRLGHGPHVLCPTCGTAPVRLAISGDGKNVYVVNSGSNTVTIFQCNTSTGVLMGNEKIATAAGSSCSGCMCERIQ